jgi:hypothetical protein
MADEKWRPQVREMTQEEVLRRAGALINHAVVFTARPKATRKNPRPEWKHYGGIVLDKGPNAEAGIRLWIKRSHAVFANVPLVEPITEPKVVGRDGAVFDRGLEYEDPVPAANWEYGGFYDLVTEWKAAESSDDEDSAGSDAPLQPPLMLDEEVVNNASAWGPFLGDPDRLLMALRLKWVTPYSGAVAGGEQLEEHLQTISTSIRMWAQVPEIYALPESVQLAQKLLDVLRYKKVFLKDGLTRAEVDLKRLALGEKGFGPVGADGFSLASATLLHEKRVKSRKEVEKKKEKKKTFDKATVRCFGCGQLGHFKHECQAQQQAPKDSQARAPSAHVMAVPLNYQGAAPRRGQ